MKAVREEGLATNAVAGETSYSLKRRTGVTGGREREVSRQTQRACMFFFFLEKVILICTPKVEKH